jgi:predicted phage terminase large subunit-like protein
MSAARALTAEDYAFSRLLSYIAYQWPGYRDAEHHRLICRKLEAVERGEIKRLIISVPPRHGKSLIASTYFPAWYLGRNPDKYIITATYGQDLADDFGRQVKNQIADEAFAGIFPGVALANDSRSSRRFAVDGQAGGIEQATNRQGAYYAVGVGGPLTGRGAHVLIVDDPVRNREDADSDTIRRKIKDWFTSTAFTRLMPGGAVIVIQTRWHEDDLTGWLLSEHAAEGWDVIHLPALAEENDALGREPGEALWPEQYDAEELANIRRLVGPRDWSALYQQRPAPDTGNYFKREWVIPVDTIPPREEMAIYGGSDYAVTADGGDYTVHAVVGVAHDGRMYLLDLWRKQASSDVWVDAFCALVRKWKPIGWAEETGQIKSGVGPFLIKRMLETGSYTVREQFPTRGDKAVRAQSIRGRMAMQGLHVPRDAEWVADFIPELMSFPVGVHDDQVDALGLVGQLMDRIGMGDAPKNAQPTPRHRPKLVSDGVIAPPLKVRR